MPAGNPHTMLFEQFGCIARLRDMEQVWRALSHIMQPEVEPIMCTSIHCKERKGGPGGGILVCRTSGGKVRMGVTEKEMFRDLVTSVTQKGMFVDCFPRNRQQR